MKKKYIVLIVIGCVLTFIFEVALATGLILLGEFSPQECEVDVEGYRLVKDEADNDIIIVRYDFENEGKSSTNLLNEYYIQLYQKGVGLVEVYELPKECHYNEEDQYREIRGGASYVVEIAYELIDTTSDVEVVIEDYDLYFPDTETEYIRLAK